jgi:hypothetical protein
VDCFTEMDRGSPGPEADAEAGSTRVGTPGGCGYRVPSELFRALAGVAGARRGKAGGSVFSHADVGLLGQAVLVTCACGDRGRGDKVLKRLWGTREVVKAAGYARWLDGIFRTLGVSPAARPAPSVA